jgi:hypothetical protein
LTSSTSSSSYTINTVKSATSWSTEVPTDICKTGVFRKLITWHWWQSHFILLIPSQEKVLMQKVNGENWQCCLKRRPKVATSLGLRLRHHCQFRLLFLIYKVFKIRWSTKRNYPASSINNYDFHYLRFSHFYSLNMFLFRSANHSQGHNWFTPNKHSGMCQNLHQNIVSVPWQVWRAQ